MSDHLSNIADKSLNMVPVVQPRPVSLFEPVHAEGVLGARYRFSEGAPDELSDSEEIQTAEMGSITAARSQTQRHQPNTNSVIDPFKAPTSTTPESAPRDQPDRLPQSVMEFSETIRDTTAAQSSSRATRTQREFVQDDLPTAKPLPAGEQRRPRVKPYIERAAIDFRGIPVSQRSRTPSFRTTETMSIQPSPGRTIQVTIGRIEVRAATPPASSQKQRPAPKTLSLDEYLGKHNGGGR